MTNLEVYLPNACFYREKNGEICMAKREAIESTGHQVLFEVKDASEAPSKIAAAELLFEQSFA